MLPSQTKRPVVRPRADLHDSALWVLPMTALVAVTLGVLVTTGNVTTKQFFGFGLLPLLSIVFRVARVTHPKPSESLHSRWLVALVGALITLVYGIRSYSGSPLRLGLLALALLLVVNRVRRIRFGSVLLLPGVVLVLGEIFAGAASGSEVVVGITTVVLWVLLLKPMSTAEVLETIRNALLIAVVAILLAFAAGVSRPYTRWYRFDADTRESRGGLTNFRWYLPLSSSWEPPALLAIILFLVSVALLVSAGTRSRALSVAGVLIGVVTVFGVNGRTSELVLLSGGAVLLVALRFGWIRLPAMIISTIFMFFPMIYKALSLITDKLSALAVSTGFAESSAKFESYEGRTYVWDTSLRVFADSSSIHQIFGYGANGYITSGASALYSHQFYGTAGSGGYRESYVDTHNLVLGVLLSHGVFGVLLLLSLWILVVRRILSQHKNKLDWIAPFIGVWVFGTMSSTSTSCIPSNATYGLMTIVLMLSPFLGRAAGVEEAVPLTVKPDLTSRSLKRAAVKSTFGQHRRRHAYRHQ